MVIGSPCYGQKVWSTWEHCGSHCPQTIVWTISDLASYRGNWYGLNKKQSLWSNKCFNLSFSHVNKRIFCQTPKEGAKNPQKRPWESKFSLRNNSMVIAIPKIDIDSCNLMNLYLKWLKDQKSNGSVVLQPYTFIVWSVYQKKDIGRFIGLCSLPSFTKPTRNRFYLPFQLNTVQHFVFAFLFRRWINFNIINLIWSGIFFTSTI